MSLGRAAGGRGAPGVAQRPTGARDTDVRNRNPCLTERACPARLVEPAIARPVQCVVSPGGSANVSSTTRSISADGNGGSLGFLVLWCGRPATPSRMNRSCQRHTQGFEAPAVKRSPSEDAAMTRPHQAALGIAPISI